MSDSPLAGSDSEIVGSFKREWRSEDGRSGGVEVEHVTRCETCWALVLRIDASEHDRWHGSLQRALTALGEWRDTPYTVSDL